jgi:hypothetical protein
MCNIHSQDLKSALLQLTNAQMCHNHSQELKSALLQLTNAQMCHNHSQELKSALLQLTNAPKCNIYSQKLKSALVQLINAQMCHIHSQGLQISPLKHSKHSKHSPKIANASNAIPNAPKCTISPKWLPMCNSKHKPNVRACNQPYQGLISSKHNLTLKCTQKHQLQPTKPQKKMHSRLLSWKWTYTIWFEGARVNTRLVCPTSSTILSK